jgi:hypothetical protein
MSKKAHFSSAAKCKGIVFGYRTLATFLSFYFVLIAYGIGLYTFIIMRWIILARGWAEQATSYDWYGETGNWKLETWR